MMLMLGAFTFNFCSRTTDDKTGASSKIVFNVLRTEKGDKIITNTEVLLELETNDHIATLLGDMEENDPVKETLVNVIPKELLTSFKNSLLGRCMLRVIRSAGFDLFQLFNVRFASSRLR